MNTTKHLKNLTILFSLTFVPAIGFIYVSRQYAEQISWITPMLVTMAGMFIFEIIGVRLSQDYIWASVSKTVRGKIVFVVSLTTLWLLGLLPLQQKIESLWASLFFIALGGAVAVVIIHIFGTEDMRKKLLASPFKKFQ
jgi:hypothetical protein